MVKLFNIQLQGKVISCDYTPENSELAGHIEIDTNSEEITNIQYSNYQYGKKMYVSQARQKLIEIFKSGEPFPKQTVSIWY